MRKITKSLMLLAATAMTFASCTKEKESILPTPEEGTIRVKFAADAALTKVGLTPDGADASFTASWDDEDQIAITSFVHDGAVKETVDALWSSDDECFMTLFESEKYATGSYDFVGVWPVGKDADKLFPAERHQKGAEYNGDYDLMKSSRASTATLTADETIVLDMVRQTSIAYFHITSELNENIVSATLTTDKPIASSNATLDYSGFEPNAETAGVTSIKLIIDGEMSSSDFKLWFNVLPVQYETMSLLIETANHSFSLSKKSSGEWKAGELNKVVLTNVPAEKWAEIERPAGESTETIAMTYSSVSENTYTPKTSYETTDGIVTLTFAKADANNDVAWNNNSSELRLYANGTLTITAGEYKIKKIVYDAVINGGGKDKNVYPAPTSDVGVLDAENSIWTGNENTVVITPVGTVGNMGFKSITVTYEDPNASSDPIYKYSVVVNKDITNGTVSVDKTSAKEGDEVTITATPASGYELVAESVKAYNAVSGAELPVTNNKFTMPAANVNVTAEFSERTKYPINLSQTIGGTISSDLAQAWTGQTVTLSKELSSEYVFKAWDVKYGSENTPITVTDDKFTMPAAAVTASATFIPTLTVSPMNPTKKESPAGSWDFTVTTVATDWEVSVPNDQDWASVEKTNNGFSLTYTANELETESTEDRSVVITVSSEQAEKTGESAIKITFTQSGKKYIAPGTGYNLVTDASDLSAGMVIVLGCAETSKVAGALGGNAYLSDQDANISEGVLTSNNAIEFTLGGSSAAWTLTSEEGQLGATAAKKMSSDPSVDNYVGTWTITIDGDGNASITSTTSGYGTIKYNATSPRFLNYASGQTDIQIYAKDDGLENRNLAFSANSDTKDIKDGTSVSVLGLNGVTDGTRTYKSSDETVATIANDGAITLLSEGTTTISVSIAKNETYRAGSAEYMLTVNDTREACATPTASPAAGEVEKDTEVTLSCSTANSTIYYRIGTTGEFVEYSSAITIDAAKTIQAYAIADGYKQSSIDSFEYTISGDDEPTTSSTGSWDLTSTNSDWTASLNETYFSQPYGYKKANGTLTNKSISAFSDKNISQIKVGFKCLQNGGTTSKLTIYLVDKNGNTLGSGVVVTPDNKSAASQTTYKYATFTTIPAGATGFMMKVTTFGKNILINGAEYEVKHSTDK